jgi:pyruvate carboxylase
MPGPREQPTIRKLLVANRSEIAIRVFRAARELGIGTVGIYSLEDRFGLHRFKSDESYLVGRGQEPVGAYLGIDDILRVAAEAGADAVHPGYGFLAENPAFAEACERQGLGFIGPPPDVMRRLGNKVEARAMAEAAGVPVMPATGALPDDPAEVARLAREVGFPLMVKASWGGGGRGMRMVAAEDELAEQVAVGRREAKAAFGNDEVFLERLVERARHIEVQILGDAAGTVVHLYERDCSVQRRHQKVVEAAPATTVTAEQRGEVCDAAVRLARAAGYRNAGTVEFLMDADSGCFYFIEVNPRLQVEHTVTEVVTGIDIVKAQIRLAEGAKIGTPESGVPQQDDIRVTGYALQCRITTETPENRFIPDYGRISAYRGATGFGIRLDGGTAYSGAIVTPFYDSLLEKVTAWAPTRDEAIARMRRALHEFRIRGVKTNLAFLGALLDHPTFRSGRYTTRFIDETPELLRFPRRRDRATRLMSFLADVMVNGNPEVAGRPEPGRQPPAPIPTELPRSPEPGTRQLLEDLGPEGFAAWMRTERRLLVTDTTFRDAHQSLLATRMRTYDLLGPARAYAESLTGLLSLEAWGGATFDVAMRFLKEDPWERLTALRSAVPTIAIQMLLRASNAVGYTNYPDNVVRFFVERSAAAGVDIFRIFDSLNWVENMRVAIEAVREAGKVCEAAICYTGDLTEPSRGRYDLGYYVGLAKELEQAGAHVLGIKDMAGVCKPEAARRLVGALREEIGLPVHLHTHDTSGISAATVLAAAEAGVDAVDAALDPMSGLTSQPNLGSIADALRGSPRDTGLSRAALASVATYWEGVRRFYAAFESDMRAGTASVYEHEMPGGQYTNLQEQARSLGLASRWPDVARRYTEVNAMFGDIIKVTPTSKVVGDLALYMVANDLTPADVADPAREISFPESVVEFFHGDLGQPAGGFPPALQRKVLKGREPLTVRPGEILPDADLDAARADVEARIGRSVSDEELASYLLYPKVFIDFAEHRRKYGDVSVLPTPAFFYGADPDEEIAIDIDPGRTLIIRCLAVGDPDAEGRRTVFFELNGQPRQVTVSDRARPGTAARRKAEVGNPAHVAAPMPGMVAGLQVVAGQRVEKGDRLLSIEAMKMETAIFAEMPGVVSEVMVTAGTQIDGQDLLMVLAPAPG